eukprot:scpid88227/ scgid33886/ 
MPNTCSVPSCQNNGKSVAKVATARGVVFYRIPKNPAQREAWLRALNENAPHRNFTGEHVRICSEHFPNGRNSQDVVPTRFVAHDALATGLAELPVLNNVAAEVPVAEVEQHVQVIQDPHALHIDDADAAHVMSPVAAAMATGEGSVSTGATASQSTGHVATSKSSGERGSVAATGNSRRATVGVRQSSSAGKDSGMASSANSLTSQDEDTEENSQKQGQGQSDHTHSLDVSSITSIHSVNDISHSSSRAQRQSQTSLSLNRILVGDDVFPLPEGYDESLRSLIQE